MPPVKKINKTDELFNINGISIKKDAQYKIQNRFDASAPSGFQKEKTTKIPSADIGNTIQCPYVGTATAGVYDTGFYEHSPCYKNEDKVRVKEKLKALQTYVIEPYEAFKGQEGLLGQKNIEFWDGLMIDIYADRMFNTADPEDMLQLYIAMQAGELCPESAQGNPKYKQADYVIIDKAKEKTVKQRKSVSNITAIGRFFALLSENPQRLLHLLRYVGVANVTEKTDSTTFMTLFQTWLDNADRNAEIFEELLDKAEDPAFEEILYMFSTIKSLVDKRKISKSAGGDYTYTGIPLGKDLKIVAQNLILNGELADVKAQILEEK